MNDSVFGFISVVVGVTLAALVFFAVLLGAADYFNGVLATHDGAYETGKRVGSAAFGLGPVMGVYLGLSMIWGARHGADAPAIGLRIVSTAIGAVILVPLLPDAAATAVASVLHYGAIGKFALTVFFGGGASLAHSNR